MNDYLSSHVPIVALTFFLAGIVKGVAGMGLPTVAMGVLSAIMSAYSGHGRPPFRLMPDQDSG